MAMATFRISTLGCKMNQYESSGVEELLAGAGYEPAGVDGPADVHIINTCTVTGKTDQRSRQAIRRARELSPDGLIVVTGCYAQRRPEELAALSEADIIIGNNEKTALLRILTNSRREGQQRIQVSDISETRTFSDFRLTRFSDYTRAFVKVQDGCDCHCAYCAVVDARGPSRSLAPERVIVQIRELHQRHFREIVLTGINLGQYGRDVRPETSLAELLEMITSQVPIARLRLSSVEPQEWSESLIRTITLCPRICRHFHIPLQSGSDRILESMRRRYHRLDFATLVQSIHTAMPDACIGADVIAGFPGESEEDFAQTEALVTSLPLSYLHPFGYSSRPGTVASSLPDDVPADIRKQRVKRLRVISDDLRVSFRRRFIGSPLSVLVLSKRERTTGKLVGLTDNYINVLFDGDDTMFNTFQTVIVTDEERGLVFGRLERPAGSLAAPAPHPSDRHGLPS